MSDLVEQAAAFRLDKGYPEGCSENGKRSIQRKAKQLVIRDG